MEKQSIRELLKIAYEYGRNNGSGKSEKSLIDLLQDETVISFLKEPPLITEIPDKWLLLKLPNNYYKVLASWAGNYLDGERWRINSGIKSIKQDENFYYFIGFSGSCYKCHKKYYGRSTVYIDNVVNKIVEKSKGQTELIKEENVQEVINVLLKQ